MRKPEFDKFVEEQLSWLRERYESGLAIPHGEAVLLCRKRDGKSFTESDPARTFMAMPGLSDEDIRRAVKEAAWEGDAFAASVKLEVWAVSLDGLSPEDRGRVEEAHAAGKLDELEPPLRRERVRVFLERDDADDGPPLRVFEAEILREPDGLKARLTDWDEAEIRLPRPNFRRYLPEVRDGRLAHVIPCGNVNVVLTRGTSS